LSINVYRRLLSGSIEARAKCCPDVAQDGEIAMRRLTDRTLRTLRPAKANRRYDVMDVEARGLGVRVNDKGLKTFIVIARYPGAKSSARRTLGVFPDMSLAEAREGARYWRRLVRDGIDPRVEQQKRRLEEARRQENSFSSVAEAYFAHLKRQGLRRAREVERDIRREFMPHWAQRAITDIARHDVLQVIESAIDRGAPWQAHHIHSYANRLFNWAIERGTYGLESSPCDRMRPAKIIGKKVPRSRVLADDELRAFWRAANRIDYPFGPLFQILALTGQRRSEVANARWGEIDLKRKLWTIPAARMKANAAHVVPLTAEVMAILLSLPRFNKGDCLFTTTFGAKPVNGFSKAKKRLDREMWRTLNAVARLRGDARATLAPFVLHDIRRTMRTGLSALPVSDLVRELVISHTKPGLHKVYDQHAYFDEKRHALELWEARLRSIVTPPPENVVQLRAQVG
jgi:integrase